MPKVVKKIKLQITAAKATTTPPVGTVLGPAGVNIGDFVNKFNEATRDKMGDIIPVDLSVYEDRTFSFVLKTPPASRLILKILGIEKGSQKPGQKSAATITKAQVRQVSEQKMPDLSAASPEAADRIIEGTARSMGIQVK